METSQTKNRLLLVDGDQKSLRVLDVSLKKAGFDVTTASSGREALASLDAELPDLIISDTDLEEMDGFELCNRIKSKSDWAKIPFLFVSSRKSIEDKIRGLELGVDDYLTKPIYIKEIGIRVRTALQRAERERMESRREGRTRFAGALSDVGVVDLVQTIELNRKSGIIHIVNRDDRRGSIFFREGKVIDAEVGRLSGAFALYRMFSWTEGQFAVEFKHIRRHDVIEQSMAALLMEGMRRLDESTHLLESLPSPTHVLEVDCRVLAEELAELPDEMNSVLRLCDGARTLQEVVEDSDLPDLETLTIISKLYLGQIIFSRQLPDHAGEPQPAARLANWLSEGGAEAPLVSHDASSDAHAAAAELSVSKALLLPGAQALPATANEAMSAEETLGAVLPSRSEDHQESSTSQSPPADTLKGIPVDNLFSEPDSSDSESQPIASAAISPVASPPRDEEGRTTAPIGLAERLLSADSALHSATMHEVMGEADGRVSEPQPVDRHTHSYNDPAAQAAALVQEVVSSTRSNVTQAPPPAQPARPTKEVDWGAWPTDSSSQPPSLQPGVFVVKPVVSPPAVPFPERSSPSSNFSSSDFQELSRADVLPEEPKPQDPSPPSATEDPSVSSDASVPIEQGDPAKSHSSAIEPPSEASSEASPPTRISLVPPPTSKDSNHPPASPSPLSSLSSGHLSAEGLQILRASSHSGRFWLLVIAAFWVGVGGVLAISRLLLHQDEPSLYEPSLSAESSASATSISASPPSSPSPKPAPSPEPAASTHPEGATPQAGAAEKSSKPEIPAKSPNSESASLRRKCLAANADGKGKARAVASICKPALEADPNDSELLVIMARAEIDRGHLSEARSLAKKALAVDPNRFDAFVYLGTAEQAAGKIEEARAAYKKYLEFAPDGPFARELRAILTNL